MISTRSLPGISGPPLPVGDALLDRVGDVAGQVVVLRCRPPRCRARPCRCRPPPTPTAPRRPAGRRPAWPRVTVRRPTMTRHSFRRDRSCQCTRHGLSSTRPRPPWGPRAVDECPSDKSPVPTGLGGLVRDVLASRGDAPGCVRQNLPCLHSVLLAFAANATFTLVVIDRARQGVVANEAYLDLQGSVDAAWKSLNDFAPSLGR